VSRASRSGAVREGGKEGGREGGRERERERGREKRSLFGTVLHNGTTSEAYLSSADPLEEDDDMDRRYRTYTQSRMSLHVVLHTLLHTLPHTRPREMPARCHKRVGKLTWMPPEGATDVCASKGAINRTILMEDHMAKRYKTLPTNHESCHKRVGKRYKTLPPNRRDVALEECFTSAVSPRIAAGDMSICNPPGGVNLTREGLNPIS
jgi:hypothetical protein